MSATISWRDWVRFLDTQYLSTFVLQGGASIKFAVPVDGRDWPPAVSALKASAEAKGYLVAHVDSSITKVHAIDSVFFHIAQQVPWLMLADLALCRLATEKGYLAPEAGDSPLVERLAKANDIDKGVVMMDLRRQLAKHVFKNHHITKDLRVALMHICLAHLTGGEEGATTVRVLTDWLTGRNKAIGAVRVFQMYTAISRTNARHFLESLLRWVRFAGCSGLLVTLDIGRVGLARNLHDDKHYYTKAGVLDTFELLRQFLDSTDRLVGCLLVVLTHPSFLDDDSGRGVAVYGALKQRVFDEVRDKHRVNPMASLVRLA
jgi:hypothetical protein